MEQKEKELKKKSKAEKKTAKRVRQKIERNDRVRGKYGSLLTR